MAFFLYMWVLRKSDSVGTGNSVSSKCSSLGGEAVVKEEASSTRVLTEAWRARGEGLE